jgi:multiple sugar transport system ATP-binding protein
MIYVTHDQVEAMTMGDRICVMKDGRIVQVAEPLGLYDRPANMFVAGFIGSPPMNFFRGTLLRANGRRVFAEGGRMPGSVRIVLPDRLAHVGADHCDRPIVLGVRPEDLREAEGDAGAADCIEAMVEVSEPMGAETFLHLNTGATAFIARVHPTAHHEGGQRVRLRLDMAKVHLFDAESEEALQVATAVVA